MNDATPTRLDAQAALLDAAEFSALIGNVYDCILDKGRWPGVLEQLCGAMGGCAASLNVHRLADQASDLLVEHGTDPAYSKSYVETYSRINPLFSDVILHMNEGDFLTLYDAVDARQFRKTRFFREWVAPQGWGDWLGGLLIRSASRISLLTVARHRTDGAYPPGALALTRLLLPHIRRAVHLGQLLDDRAACRDGLAASLDRIQVAALLVGQDGVILHANALAHGLLQDGSVLTSRPGDQLSLLDPIAQTLLTKALAGGEVTPGVITVNSRAGKRTISIVAGSAASGGHTIVLVTVPETPLPVFGPLLQAAFGFTPAELRVLVLLMSGRTTEDMAGDLGVSQRTVKAHLQNLFAKSGVSRQSDLVLAVLKIIPPFE